MFKLNIYNKEKRLISSDEAPEAVDEATKAAKDACAKLLEGGEVDLVAHAGDGQKWILGFKKEGGSAVRKK